MILKEFSDSVIIHRKEKIVYAEFLTPHKVISTCQVAGGLRDDLSYLYNHQSCEPVKHETAHRSIAVKDPLAYRSKICGNHDLPEDKCATLGTAANMRYAVTKQASFRDLSVMAVCTGGVEGNAGRVGDPASVYEYEGKYERVSKEEPVMHGTINTMVFINRELTDGAMVRTIMTATEAKTAVLQELAVSSRYSSGLATGTGTDQIGVASRIGTGKPLSGAGKHSVLGELIGKAVFGSIKGTLALQNGLTPESQRSSLFHLTRYGATQENMISGILCNLDKEHGKLLEANFYGIERDPLVVAAVAAIVHLRDKIAWGILPESCFPEVSCIYGAQLASAVSGNYNAINKYINTLSREKFMNTDESFLILVNRAIALGYNDKWNDF
ncbi:MAG: adenosylcobinamide amidohydrolase [Spirochaetes bacterium]|nr:adenosylcobinamide amidohydrolase [Spirochaetota bacterium]